MNGAHGLPTSVTKQRCQIHLSSSTATLRSMVERITVPQGCLPYRHRGSGCRNFIKSRSAIRVRPLSAPETRHCIFLSRLYLSKIAKLERPRRHPQSVRYSIQLIVRDRFEYPVTSLRPTSGDSRLLHQMDRRTYAIQPTSSKNWFDKALRTSTIIGMTRCSRQLHQMFIIALPALTPLGASVTIKRRCATG